MPSGPLAMTTRAGFDENSVSFDLMRKYTRVGLATPLMPVLEGHWEQHTWMQGHMNIFCEKEQWTCARKPRSPTDHTNISHKYCFNSSLQQTLCRIKLFSFNMGICASLIRIVHLISPVKARRRGRGVCKSSDRHHTLPERYKYRTNVVETHTAAASRSFC